MKATAERSPKREITTKERGKSSISTTAILLNKIRLVAMVGGTSVTNPFVVTEVYVQQDGGWELASLSFTKLLTPEQH